MYDSLISTFLDTCCQWHDSLETHLDAHLRAQLGIPSDISLDLPLTPAVLESV